MLTDISPHRALLTISDGDGGTTRAFAALGLLPDAVILRYNEPAQSGLSGSRSTLTLYKDKALLTRSGSHEAELRFLPGRRCEGRYDAGLGAWRAEVETLAYKAVLGETGNARIFYRLWLNGDGQGARELNISWQARPRAKL